MHFRDSPDFLNGLGIPGNNWFHRFTVTYTAKILEDIVFLYEARFPEHAAQCIIVYALFISLYFCNIFFLQVY